MEPAARIDRRSKHGLAFKNEVQEARLQSGHDQTEVVSRIDIVDAAFSLQLQKKTPATARLVIPKYCNGRDVGTIGHIAGEHGHRCLQHRHVRGTLLFGFGDCLGYLAAAYCRRRDRGIEMIERLHVEHHFV